MIAAGDAWSAVRGGSLRRWEDQVELGEGRSDRGQVRFALGIWLSRLDDGQDALGLPQIGEELPQEVIRAGFRDGLTRGIHGREA